MKRAVPVIYSIAMIALAGCPGDDPVDGNAQTLWLAPDGVETEVKLIEAEPPPF